MKIKFNYKIQKELSFILIFITGISYVLFIYFFLTKVLSGFIMQIIFLLESFKTGNDLQTLLVSNEFYTNLIGGFILIILLIRVINSIFKSIKSLINTKQFIDQLNIINIDSEKYIFQYSLPLVFTSGIFKPKIYVSNCLIQSLDQHEIRSIILHEKQHKISYDPLKKIIIELIKSALPYLPFKYQIFKSYEVLTELTCDMYSQEIMNSKRYILSAMLKIFNFEKFDNILINGFNINLDNDRIGILAGTKKFKTSYFFMVILTFFISTISANVMLNRYDPFVEYNHIPESISSILSYSNSYISIAKNELCTPTTKGISTHTKYYCMSLTSNHPYSSVLN